MNANELAKGLSQNQIYGDDHGLFNRRIQNMLRQQQAEIEALKAKTLTDEEIEELAEYHGIDSLYETGRLDFARAILRKAQEK